MSILSSGFPGYVEVGGEKYAVHTDFQRWICFEQMMKINPPEIRIAEILKKYYVSLPPKLYDAVGALCRFYAGGVAPKAKDGAAGKRLYCYEQDAESIYCAFYAQYHIDLEKDKLHWWKFLTLLKGLDQNCRFMQIVRLRAMDLSEIKDKSQRSRVAELKRKYALYDDRSSEQKEQDFADKISMLF